MKMNIAINKLYIILLLTMSIHAHSHAQSPPKHEFRGVWIASVMNIDWPTKATLTPQEQQLEFINILKTHKANGMNAVVVQVRPAADAFYPSPYEPWSKWLTGKLGRPPQPYYDPLQFMIAEAHKLGLEFHAWFNPYRGIMNVDTSNIDSASVAFQHPHWFVKYDKHLYFNPGLPEARKHVTNVVLDVVNRYAVDGIHFDDYFYPYKVSKLTFPDSATFQQYGQAFQHIDDWRRNNVDLLIKEISDSIKQVKPHVQFGISPFGVWRNQDKDPNGSATRAGQTCYDDLYADVLKWLREGWIDYITPQIYWSIGFEAAPYEVLAAWWNKNSYGKPVYIGQAAYRINGDKDARWKEANQMPRQLTLNRALPNIKGSIYFSARSFTPNPLGICDTLKNNYYKYPALTPPQNKTNTTAQPALSFISDGHSITLRWQAVPGDTTLSPHARYIIYRFSTKEKINLSNPKKIIALLANTNPNAPALQSYQDSTAKRGKKYRYILTTINKYRTESTATQAYPVKYNKHAWRTYEPHAYLTEP